MPLVNSRNDFNEADLICPLSQQIFLDPVKVPLGPLKKSDGTFEEKYVTVERQVIEKWITENGKNPFTQTIKNDRTNPRRANEEKC